MSKWVYVFVAMMNFIALVLIGISEKRIDMGFLATVAIFAHFAEHEFEKEK